MVYLQTGTHALTKWWAIKANLPGYNSGTGLKVNKVLVTSTTVSRSLLDQTGLHAQTLDLQNIRCFAWYGDSFFF